MQHIGKVRIFGTVIAIVALSACGGGGSSTEAIEDVAPVVAGDEPVVEIEETGDNCLDALSAFNAMVQGVTLNLMNPSEFDIEAHRENVRRAKEVAPSEVADDFAIVADAYLTVGEVLDEIGKTGGLTTPENLEKLNELSVELEQPEVQDTAERLAAYFENECAGG